MNDTKSKIIERIRKLLSRTPGAGATQAEAETAIALARKLMDQHGLDSETVQSHTVSGEEWVTESAWEGDGIRMTPSVSFIGPILCRFFRVKVFSEQLPPPSFGCSVQIFGDRPRVEVARWVYVFLDGMFQDLWVAHRLATRCRKDRQRAYYLGLATAIITRLERERREEIAESGKPSTGSELVVVDGKLAAAFEAAYPGMKRGRKSTFRDGNSVRAGQRDGESINIARPMAAEQSRAIGGPCQ